MPAQMKQARDRYARDKAAGICPKCRKRPSRENRTTCQACADHRRTVERPSPNVEITAVGGMLVRYPEKFAARSGELAENLRRTLARL